MPSETHHHSDPTADASSITINAASNSSAPSAAHESPMNNSTSGQLPLSASQPPRKLKGKKISDAANASKQIYAKIAQLEQDVAGEKDQDAEIDREVKKANRDLSNLLSTIETPMVRLDAVQKKYAELFADMKRTERDYIKAKKKADLLQKEKDSSRTELNKANSVKDKLEKLSREVTKENKKLKDDLNILRASETKVRDELHDWLEKIVSDVENAISSKENPRPEAISLEMDELFRRKFKSFLEQYELRELQYHSLLRTKDMEIHHQLSRFEQQRKAQESESSKSQSLTRQVSTFSQTETELRSQLNIYVEKFKQVEDTLNNSNDLFLTFRKEMEEMAKKTKRLEKENLHLTRKQESTNRNILEMAEERANTLKELERVSKKSENLEKLCRGMQAQGRGQVKVPDLEVHDGSTESEYEYEEEGEEGSPRGEYDEDTEEEPVENKPRKFGSPHLPRPPHPPHHPPPSPSFPNTRASESAVRKVNGQLTGTSR